MQAAFPAGRAPRWRRARRPAARWEPGAPRFPPWGLRNGRRPYAATNLPSGDHFFPARSACIVRGATLTFCRGAGRSAPRPGRSDA